MVEDSAFFETRIKSIDFGNKNVTIKEQAFEGAASMLIKFGAGNVTICANAFTNCTGDFVASNANITFSDSAFANAKFRLVDLSKLNMTSVGSIVH